MALKLRIVDAGTCQPIRNAVVAVWHCDGSGYYSGYPDQNPDSGNTEKLNRSKHIDPSDPNEHFLRGTQRTDANGEINFLTIYPGWYAGRTVHIHCKVYLNDKEALTTQLFFKQALNNEVHISYEPYAERAPIPVPNEMDDIFKEIGTKTTLNARKENDKIFADLEIGVVHG